MFHQLYQRLLPGNILATSAAPAQPLSVLDSLKVGFHGERYKFQPVSKDFAHIAGFRLRQEWPLDCVVDMATALGNRSLESGNPQAAGVEVGKAWLEDVTDVGPGLVYRLEMRHDGMRGRGAPVSYWAHVYGRWTH